MLSEPRPSAAPAPTTCARRRPSPPASSGCPGWWRGC